MNSLAELRLVSELTDRELAERTLDELRAIRAQLDRIEARADAWATRSAVDEADVTVERSLYSSGWSRWHVLLNGHRMAGEWNSRAKAEEAAADIRLELRRWYVR